jgi:repressor LexA
MTQSELGEILNLRKTTISNYESGVSSPDYDTLNKIAEYFGVSTDYLLRGKDSPHTYGRYLLDTTFNTEKARKVLERHLRTKDDENLPPEAFPPSELVKVPIYGEIRAGKPILADHHIEGYEYMPKEHVQGGTYFCLRVKGDSMIDAHIPEGSTILVRKQETLNDGEIGVFLVNDQEEYTIKRYKRKGDMVILKPENPNHDIQIYHVKDVIIVGEVVQVLIRFNGRK